MLQIPAGVALSPELFPRVPRGCAAHALASNPLLAREITAGRASGLPVPSRGKIGDTLAGTSSPLACASQQPRARGESPPREPRRRPYTPRAEEPSFCRRSYRGEAFPIRPEVPNRDAPGLRVPGGRRGSTGSPPRTMAPRRATKRHWRLTFPSGHSGAAQRRPYTTSPDPTTRSDPPRIQAA